MVVTADILDRRATRFALWSPRDQSQAPRLLIGTFAAGNPPSVVALKKVALTPAPGVVSGLWELRADDPGLALVTGRIYHYWLEVDDSRSGTTPPRRMAVTDPSAGPLPVAQSEN
jgi:hypothetical protein